MKIIYCGKFNEESTNYSQARELRKISELIEYPIKVKINELGFDEMNRDIINFTKLHKPDMLLIAKGVGLNHLTINICNQVTKTCMWYMDAFPHGNWDNNHIERLKQCSFICCDKTQAVNEALKYNKNVYKLCEGYDQEIDKYIPLEQNIDVSFIGGIYGNRASICSAINATVYTSVYGLNHSKVVNHSKINLNFCTHLCASDRIYKILAAKGFLLTDDWTGREFEDGKHLVIFNNLNDLQDKIEYYLNHEYERNLIAEAGYKEVQQYNRINWANELINIYNSIDF